MARSTYHHKNLREELIDKGLRLLDESGYEKFSLRKVAVACGVSQTAPYRHFKNKDNLIMAIIAEVNHRLNEALGEAAERFPNDATNQLREIAYLYVKFFTENPEYFKFLFFCDASKKIKLTRENYPQFDNMERPEKTFVNSVEKYITQNESECGRKLDRNAVVLASWGMAHGIAMLISQQDFRFAGDCMGLVKNILWSGLFAGAGAV